MAIPFTPAWRAERERQRRASVVAASLMREPEEADVSWLADAAANGDADHALWELRYARAALGLLVAQRDSLDDRTSAEIAAVYTRILAHDPRIAEDRRELAARQFNERLATYRETMQAKGGPVLAADRLGRCLLAYASDGARTAGSPLPYAIELLERYVAEAAAELRAAYGEARLPEDVKPSVLAQGSRGAAGGR